MTRAVWKYPFRDQDTVQDFTLNMPAGAVVLHIGKQGKQTCMWVDCVPDNALVERRFRIHTTGQDIEANEVYLGTFQELDGSYVGHVFEVAA